MFSAPHLVQVVSPFSLWMMIEGCSHLFFMMLLLCWGGMPPFKEEGDILPALLLCDEGADVVDCCTVGWLPNGNICNKFCTDE